VLARLQHSQHRAPPDESRNRQDSPPSNLSEVYRSAWTPSWSNASSFPMRANRIGSRRQSGVHPRRRKPCGLPPGNPGVAPARHPRPTRVRSAWPPSRASSRRVARRYRCRARVRSPG
jgi:hypothetical protein